VTSPRTHIAGTRAVADLPHSCHCGSRWAGSSTAHCGACHRTFTGVAPFDAHRRGGACTEPADAGLTAVPGRAYEAWGTTGTQNGGTDAV